jgi:hypothetical protein
MDDLKLIYKACCDASGLDLSSKSRRRDYAYARMVYFYFARKATNSSLATIGKLCKRDHATVLNGIKKYKEYIEYDDFKEISQRLENAISDVYFIGDVDNPINVTVRYFEKMLMEMQTKLDEMKEMQVHLVENKDIEDEIIELFKVVPRDKLIEFKEYRVKPFLKMNNYAI